MSLDGFIEHASGSVVHLFAWITPETEAAAERAREAIGGIGALVSGRRLFDLVQGWRGQHPLGVPVFVVTHRVPEYWAHPDAPFTFVTDGVASAVEQARAVAGHRSVAVASAEIAQQRIDLGLLDAITVDLVPGPTTFGARHFLAFDLPRCMSSLTVP